MTAFIRTCLLSSALIATIWLFGSCTQPATNINEPRTTPPVTDASVKEAEVKKFITEFAATMSKNDVVGLDKMWAADFTFVSHDGENFSKAQLLDVLRSGTEKFESVTFENVRVRIYGDTAVVSANGTQRATLEGKDHSGRTVVSIVLVKSVDGWHMVLAHLAELKPLAKKR